MCETGKTGLCIVSSNGTNEDGEAVNLGLSPELQLILKVSIDSEWLVHPLESIFKKKKKKISLAVGD